MTKVSTRIALFLALALMVAACGGNTTDDDNPPTTISDGIPVTTFHSHPAPPMPDIAELAALGPDAVVDVEWTRIAVPAGPEGGFVQYESVFALGGRFFLIGTFYPDFEEPTEELGDEELDEQYNDYRAGIRPILWSSEAGQAWDEVDLGDVPPVEYLQPVMIPDGVLFVGTVWESPTGPYTAYFRSTDGVSWEQGIIEGSRGAFGVASAGAVDGRMVLIGSYEVFDGVDDVSVQKDGLVFTRSWSEERVTVTDESGTLLFEESIDWIDQFSAETEEGLRIFDPDTGDVLMVVPSHTEPDDDGSLVYESGGYRLEAELADDPGSFRVTDAEGLEVLAGTLDDLWSAGTIVVPDGSGGVLMEVTFVELWEAESNLYDEAETEAQRVFALIERDGGGWDEVEIDLGDGEPYGGMAQGDAGLVLASTWWSEEAITTEFLRTTDGRSWELLTSVERPLNELSTVGGRYLAVGDAGAGGAALFVSDEGTSWDPVLVVRGSVGSGISPGLATSQDGALVIMSEWGGGGGPAIVDAGNVEVFVEGDFISVRVQDDDMVQVFLEGFVEDLYQSGELRDAGDTVEIVIDGEVIGAFDPDALEEAMESYDPEASLRENIPYTSIFLTRDGRTVTRLAGDDFEAVTARSGGIIGDTVVVLGYEATPIPGAHHDEFIDEPALLVGSVS